MSVNPVDSSIPLALDPQAQFDAAVDHAKRVEVSGDELSDAEFDDILVTQGVTIGGQFIILPIAQNILNESMSSDDDE
nr:hypothetical protein [uncultured Pseudomonas sp.]